VSDTLLDIIIGAFIIYMLGPYSKRRGV